MVADLAAGMLEELGYEPSVVHGAKEALDRLNNGDRPRLVFSDIVMPGGLSGLELARKVRNRYPEMPILLTTGYSEQVGGTHGFEVLQKPYELSSLAAAVKKVMKQGV
jgi:CheY-like chemotaxis protein